MNSSPKQNFIFFARFISSEYVESFVSDGLLYMNNIEHFRKIDNENIALRGDIFEGLAASYDSTKVQTFIGKHEIDGSLGQIDIRRDSDNKINLFCLTLITEFDLANSNYNLHLSQNFKEFGDKVVIIAAAKIPEFIRRIQSAVELDKNIIKAKSGHVEYVARNSHQESMGVFKKYEDYAWQHEWRIAIQQTHSAGAYEQLKVGSISDICMVLDTEKLISHPITRA